MFFCISCRLHVGPLTLPETLAIMVSALYQGAWSEYDGLKGLTEVEVRRLLSHRCLLDSLAELSGIPRAVQWAYSVLGEHEIMASVADHYKGFDIEVAAKVRDEIGKRVSSHVMPVKSLV